MEENHNKFVKADKNGITVGIPGEVVDEFKNQIKSMSKRIIRHETKDHIFEIEKCEDSALVTIKYHPEATIGTMLINKDDAMALFQDIFHVLGLVVSKIPNGFQVQKMFEGGQ